MGFSSSWQRPRLELPSYRVFLRCFRAFRARWPWVVDFNPWNEVNHWYQPTYRHPRRAAGFYNAARRACPRCNVAAGDLLDSGNLARWLARYRRHLRGRPRLWSLHNYLDVNYLPPWRLSGTRRMLRLTRGDDTCAGEPPRRRPTPRPRPPRASAAPSRVKARRGFARPSLPLHRRVNRVASIRGTPEEGAPARVATRQDGGRPLRRRLGRG